MVQSYYLKMQMLRHKLIMSFKEYLKEHFPQLYYTAIPGYIMWAA